jgi:ABC-type transport system substrate-binding protein
MRLRAALTILLAAVACVSAACGGGGAPAARGPAATVIPLLREGTTYTFSNLTEQYADGLPEANWSEHLVRLNVRQQVEPWLAQSVTQPGPHGVRVPPAARRRHSGTATR